MIEVMICEHAPKKQIWIDPTPNPDHICPWCDEPYESHDRIQIGSVTGDEDRPGTSMEATGEGDSGESPSSS